MIYYNGSTICHCPFQRHTHDQQDTDIVLDLKNFPLYTPGTLKQALILDVLGICIFVFDLQKGNSL